MEYLTSSLPSPVALHLPCKRAGAPSLRAPGFACAWAGVLVCLGLAAGTVQAQAEPDFFAEQVPPLQVLSVTRLAQPLADTPGAVTVLDRQTLRRSGARNITEALRLVPGYMVAGFNGANLSAAYHAPVDEYGARSLILVDGRSLYSPTFLGGGFRALNAVPIEEIGRAHV